MSERRLWGWAYWLGLFIEGHLLNVSIAFHLPLKSSCPLHNLQSWAQQSTNALIKTIINDYSGRKFTSCSCYHGLFINCYDSLDCGGKDQWQRAYIKGMVSALLIFLKTWQSQLCALSLSSLVAGKIPRTRGKENKSPDRQPKEGFLKQLEFILSPFLVQASTCSSTEAVAAELCAHLLLEANAFSALILWTLKYFTAHTQVEFLQGKLQVFFFIRIFFFFSPLVFLPLSHLHFFSRHLTPNRTFLLRAVIPNQPFLVKKWWSSGRHLPLGTLPQCERVWVAGWLHFW